MFTTTSLFTFLFLDNGKDEISVEVDSLVWSCESDSNVPLANESSVRDEVDS